MRGSATKCAIVAVVAVLSICVTGCSPRASDNPNGPANGLAQPAAGDAGAAYPYQVHADLARVYLQYNIIEEALRHFEAAINAQHKQTDTEDAELWAGFADALHKAGRKDEAAKAYQRALQVYEALFARDTETAQHNMYAQRIAALHTVLGNSAEAANWRGKMKADMDSPSQQLAMALILEAQGNADGAEACFRRALALTEGNAANNAEAKIAYAAMLNKAKRTQESEALAREVIAAPGAPAQHVKQARRLLFEIYEARGELDKLEFK
ncbi:MAG: hypothetical protein KF754_14860 [Planctomycetes bacterium]|nr:hypothetical protein [Planctomycetota bacterium]